MGIIELILLSIGLGMDAFAVSICKGISMKKMDWKKACIIGLIFWRLPSNNAYYRLFFRFNI